MTQCEEVDHKKKRKKEIPYISGMPAVLERKKEQDRLQDVLLFIMLKVNLQNKDTHMLFFFCKNTGSMALIERICKRK